MIGLKELLSVSPFSEETRNELLNKIDSLSTDKKIALTQLCWEGIASEYHITLQYEIQKRMLEIAEGVSRYQDHEFKDIQEKLISSIITKLHVAENTEDVAEVREKLKQFTKPQDNTQN